MNIIQKCIYCYCCCCLEETVYKCKDPEACGQCLSVKNNLWIDIWANIYNDKNLTCANI